MKRVAVSQRVDWIPERKERRDALDQALSAWLWSAGYLPMPVPNLGAAQAVTDWLAALSPDAIVLSGGNDLGQCLDRDDTEASLLQYAQAHGLPVLGICRGMQMMGVWLGGQLQAVEGHVRTRHLLVGDITGQSNSYHRQSLAFCPPGCRVLAQSEDGQIEALAHDRLRWEGWMWHPEREHPFAARDLQRLHALFSPDCETGSPILRD